MLAVLFILIIVIGLFIKKYIKTYDIIIILFLCFLAYHAVNVADFENYKKAYEYIRFRNNYTDLGLGWLQLCKIGNAINLSYEQFKVLIVFISALLIRSTIRFFINDYKVSSIVWTLFLIYPALLDLTQVRFLLSESIVIYAIRYIIDEKIFKNIKFLFFVIIAYTVHSTAIFYLLFLLPQVLNGKNTKYLYLVSIVGTLMCIIGKKYIISFAGLLFNQERITRYFYSTEGVGLFGVIAYSLTLILFIIISSSIKKTNNENYLQKKYLDLIYGCNIICTLLMPLTLFDTNFFRMQRIMWGLMYIALGILIKNNIKSINVFHIFFNVKNLGIIIALLGNVFYICIFNFNIVKAFLL